MLHFLEATAQPTGNMLTSLLPMIVIVAVFYFLLIRPEQKRKKEAESMRSAVKVNDEITTIGGIVGKVVNVKEDKIVIETGADQVRLELTKWSISTNDTAAAAAKEEQRKKQEARAKEKAAKKAAKNKEG